MTLFAAGCKNSFLSSQKQMKYKERKWKGVPLKFEHHTDDLLGVNFE